MIKVYTKNYCPFCVKAKNLLDSLNVDYEEIDVTEKPELIEEISKKSGFLTVPQIFVGEKCLGGYSDIARMDEEGELMAALKGN